MARVTGALYACGGLLVFLSLVLPHPAGDIAPLYSIAIAASLVGILMITKAERFGAGMIQALLTIGTALVCMCVYFSGTESGVYSTMLVWPVIVAACFSSRRALVWQTAWILVAYGAVLAAAATEPVAYSSLTRWILACFVLAVAGAATAWLVAGRRAAEGHLHREIETREHLQRELEYMANHDPLTGVANRRRLEQDLQAALDGAKRERAPLCLIALDLNGFKRFNDVEGHAAGDRLLKAAASAWSAVLREDDLMTRMGGDEFLVVLPNCPLEISDRIASRLREAVPLGQTCATGIACWDGKESAESLLGRADEAMYRAKNRRPMSVYRA